MASKAKSVFVCQSCGTRYPKWTGRCTGCGEWETITEEIESASPKERPTLSAGDPPLPLTQIKGEDRDRFRTRYPEFDNVMGGGIVKGSLTLIGGDPGIGKSTLMLQAAHALADQGHTVLYVSGEESAAQIKLRAVRLGADRGEKLLVYAENDLALIRAQIEKVRPGLCIIDSIQTIYKPDLPSAPGSVGQVRECAAELMRLSKSLGVPIFLVGHVTKEGALAGPRVLEHIVDTVLYFEGDRNNQHRILRAVKNRFGAANEIAVFEMKGNGLMEVANPSEIFLSERGEKRTGSVVACAMEGNRPLLIEIQALSSRMIFNYPQRVVSGIDGKRLSIICAVLERIADYPLSQHDLFVSVAGGLSADEPAMDLAVACAVVSSFVSHPVDPKLCILGEVGLSGEIRSISFAEPRLREAQKLGFRRILLPANNARSVQTNRSLELHGVRDISEAIRLLLDRT
ncbi:MAG: DNA repair protein RadA [Elusimicrobia bacterium RIFOXYB2_FULL_49_7]|nr:MAG: DNA repair protein RadA [Elusimicrobia bacterium RIFOXYB2_FULL_49_7]